MDTAILVAVIGITMALIEIIKSLINKFSKDNDTEVRDWLKELHDLSKKHDGQGIPLIYTPRSIIETQSEILKLLRDVSNTQAKIADILGRIENRIEASTAIHSEK